MPVSASAEHGDPGADECMDVIHPA